jgi:hypothetical protein
MTGSHWNVLETGAAKLAGESALIPNQAGHQKCIMPAVYSAIEHYAMTVCSSNWRDVTVIMFTSCFDAAGKERDQKTPLLLVAGFASMAGVWAEFDKEWCAALEKKD